MCENKGGNNYKMVEMDESKENQRTDPGDGIVRSDRIKI